MEAPKEFYERKKFYLMTEEELTWHKIYKEAAECLAQLQEEGAVAHKDTTGEMFSSSAWMIVLLAKLGAEIDPGLLGEAQKVWNEESQLPRPEGRGLRNG